MSGRYKGKLAGFAQAFTDQKAELQFLIQQKTAVTTSQIKVDIEDVSQKVDKLVAYLNTKTAKEKEITAMVDRRGGEEAVLNVSPQEKLLRILIANNFRSSG